MSTGSAVNDSKIATLCQNTAPERRKLIGFASPTAKPRSCWNEYKETGAQPMVVLDAETFSWQLINVGHPHTFRTIERADLSTSYAFPSALCTFNSLCTPIYLCNHSTFGIFSNLMKHEGISTSVETAKEQAGIRGTNVGNTVFSEGVTTL